MFEALLKRISISKHKNNIIIKGDFLLSSILGIDARSTMDIDVTIKEVTLEKENIEKTIKVKFFTNFSCLFENFVYFIYNIIRSRGDKNAKILVNGC